MRTEFQKITTSLGFNAFGIQKDIDELEALFGAKEQGNARLKQENSELRSQVYNLTLYLREALLCLNDLDDAIRGRDEDIYSTTNGNNTRNEYLNVFMQNYDGMPGYNPAILEERHE